MTFLEGGSQDGTGNEIVPCVFILTAAQWETFRKENALNEIPSLEEHIAYTRAERLEESMYVNFYIPRQASSQDRTCFFLIYADKNRLCFVDDSPFCCSILSDLKEKNNWKNPSVDKVLADFLIAVIENHGRLLHKYEQQIESMESAAFQTRQKNLENRLHPVIRSLSKLYTYYGELGDMGQTLFSNEVETIKEENLRYFKLFMDRAERLQNQAMTLKEYCMEVWEVYQTRISQEQNRIMQILTVLSAIFFPLTIITGWYGMNFAGMPELKSPFGYPAVIGMSILVVTVTIWLFKKNKFF